MVFLYLGAGCKEQENLPQLSFFETTTPIRVNIFLPERNLTSSGTEPMTLYHIIDTYVEKSNTIILRRIQEQKH